MINPIANILGQAGSSYSQPTPQYYTQAQQQSAHAYQQALHGITPALQVKQLKWMFDGEPMDIKDFAEKIFGEDDAARTMFLLKYNQ